MIEAVALKFKISISTWWKSIGQELPTNQIACINRLEKFLMLQDMDDKKTQYEFSIY